MYNIGQGTVNLLDHNEEYVVTFPSGFGRSILTVPWVELGEMSKKKWLKNNFWLQCNAVFDLQTGAEFYTPY